MSVLVALVRREIQSLFVSPIAYTVVIGFLVLCGYGFVVAVSTFSTMPSSVLESQRVTVRNFVIGGQVGLSTWIFLSSLLFLPALSMRQFSEERKTGTLELLLTSPMSTPQLVLGKYLAPLGVFGLILLLTAPMPAFLGYKTEVEWGAMVSAYLGYFLYGAVILAIGLFASSLSENQIVALVLTYVLVLPLFLVEFLVGHIGQPWDDILAAVSLGVGARSAGRGLIDTQFLVLVATTSFAFLFLSGRVIDRVRGR